MDSNKKFTHNDSMAITAIPVISLSANVTAE